MNRRILLAMTSVLAPLTFTAPAFAQAAAESVLLNGSSSAATVKVGSKLGSALNQSSNQLAGRVPQGAQAAPSQVSPGRVQSVPNSSSTSPGRGPVITSIQGASIRCAPTSKTASTDSKAAGESTQTNCNSRGSAGKSRPQSYKPVITVTLQK